jgi:N-alpha-acetyltransferase 50
VNAKKKTHTPSPSTYPSIHQPSTIHPHPSNPQTTNTDAIAFYERLGFQRGAVVPGYYRKLKPPDAVVLERRLR